MQCKLQKQQEQRDKQQEQQSAQVQFEARQLTDTDGSKRLPVKEIFTYPIKSCQGISVSQAELCHSGLLHDREFVVCGPSNDVDRLTAHFTGKTLPDREEHSGPEAGYRPITLRNTARLALVSVRIDCLAGNMHLRVHAPDMPELVISETCWSNGPSRKVLGKVPFTSDLWGQDCGDEAGNWFSRVLDPDGNLQLRLRLMKFSGERQVETGCGELRFQDVAPLLVMTTSSINQLACQQELGLTFNELVERFRPNIIVDTSEPYEEDLWQELELSANTKLLLFRPCDRCQVPSVDPKSLKWDRDNDPAKFLKDRQSKQLAKQGVHFADKLDPKRPKLVYFGMYGAVSITGSCGSTILNVGDRLLARSCVPPPVLKKDKKKPEAPKKHSKMQS